MMKAIFFLFSLLIAVFGAAKAPELTSRDVRVKIEEILKAHVCHKTLSPELMERVFVSFLDELDPTKTYFLQNEVSEWANPSQDILNKAVTEFKAGKFTVFEKIRETFAAAIERRGQIDASLEGKELPKGVKSEEFKDLAWTGSYDELSERLLRIKALQSDATKNLSEEAQSRLMQRLLKRKQHREAELIGEDKEKMTLAYILKAAAVSLDSHTNYFTPAEAGQFTLQVQQSLSGIGAQLRDDLDGLSVVRILDNSPASQSNKLKIGDKIIAVNAEPVVGMEITEAVALIRGEKGTPVKLTLLRESKEGEEAKQEKQEIELIRGQVVLDETRLETSVEPYGDGAIAVLKLFSFYQDQKTSSALDMRQAIEQIQKEYALKAVLIDLRDNSGGFLEQAMKVCELFIHKGVVVSMKDHEGKIQNIRALEGKPVWEGPLCVLVNRASASASEIVAQCLQDYGRALVVGDDFTYGKGTVQTFTYDAIRNAKVNPQGEYKVTRGKYYTVSGKSPQLCGVQSDIVVPGLLSQLDVGEKYAKFPLENDQIEPRFDDDLSDLSPMYRIQLGPMYKYNLQAQLTTYLPYIDTLKRNSDLRIGANKNYQKFLSETLKKNFDSDVIDLFNQTDLQLVETLNITKDLIFLMASDKVF